MIHLTVQQELKQYCKSAPIKIFKKKADQEKEKMQTKQQEIQNGRRNYETYANKPEHIDQTEKNYQKIQIDKT